MVTVLDEAFSPVHQQVIYINNISKVGINKQLEKKEKDNKS